MKTQTTLLEPEVKAGPRGNLFFALVPPDEKAAADIATLAQHLREEHQLKAKVISPERFHVTLHHLGDYAELPDSLVAQARQAAESVTAAPFEIAFDQARSFPVRRYAKPFVLGMSQKNAGLTALHQQLREPLISAGFKSWLTSSFTPHVTLLYDNVVVAACPIAEIKWPVREFALVYSVPRKGHVRLGTWPLR